MAIQRRPSPRGQEGSGEFLIDLPVPVAARAKSPPGQAKTLPMMNAVRHARHPGGATTSGPQRSSTVRMHVVAPATRTQAPTGRMLDQFDFADGGGGERRPLELGALPAGHRPLETIAGPSFDKEWVQFDPASSEDSEDAPAPPPPPPSVPEPPPPSVVGPPSSRRGAGPRVPVGAPMTAPDTRQAGIFAFAGFGLPPSSASALAGYALRVLQRRWSLRRGLELARARRSPDVELYEAALRSFDSAAVTKGLVILGATITVVLAVLIAAASMM